MNAGMDTSGVFGKIRQAVGGGGIGIASEVPKDFTWDDESIPVTVTVAGHKSEARNTEEFRLLLQEHDPNSAPRNTSDETATSPGIA